MWGGLMAAARRATARHATAVQRGWLEPARGGQGERKKHGLLNAAHPRSPPSWGLCGGHVGPGMHSLNWLPRTVTWRGAGAGGAKPARPTSVLWLLRGCGWGGSPPSSTLIRGSRYCRQLVRVTEDAGLGAGHNPGERKTPPPPPASPMGAFNNSKRRTTIKLGRLTENTAQHKE